VAGCCDEPLGSGITELVIFHKKTVFYCVLLLVSSASPTPAKMAHFDPLSCTEKHLINTMVTTGATIRNHRSSLPQITSASHGERSNEAIDRL
jgi:hypothetical protein